MRVPRVGANIGSRDARLAVASLQDVRQRYQPFGMREWQRTQQHAFHDRENGGRGSDSQGEHQHGRDREAGRLQQMTKRNS